MSRFGQVFVVSVVLGLVALVALTAARESGSRLDLQDVAAPVQMVGAGLPPAGSRSSVPLPSPALSMRSSAGDRVDIGASDGPEVVVFLAHWCPACQEEVPSLVRFLRTSGLPEGLRLTVVLTGLDPSRPNWPPQDWLDSEGLVEGTYGSGQVVVVVDDEAGTAMSSFGLSAYPAWAAIDAQGQVRLRLTGLLTEQGIKDIIAEVHRG